MKKCSTISVVCSECDVVVGIVTESEDPKRLGFYVNVPSPDPMPTTCVACNHPLSRLCSITGG